MADETPKNNVYQLKPRNRVEQVALIVCGTDLDDGTECDGDVWREFTNGMSQCIKCDTFFDPANPPWEQ